MSRIASLRSSSFGPPGSTKVRQRPLRHCCCLLIITFNPSVEVANIEDVACSLPVVDPAAANVADANDVVMSENPHAPIFSSKAKWKKEVKTWLLKEISKYIHRCRISVADKVKTV